MEHPVVPGDPLPTGEIDPADPLGTEDPTGAVIEVPETGPGTIFDSAWWRAFRLLGLILGGVEPPSGGGGGRGGGGTATQPTPTPGGVEDQFEFPVETGDVILSGIRIVQTFPEGGGGTVRAQLPGGATVEIPPECSVVCDGGGPVPFHQFILEDILKPLATELVPVGADWLAHQVGQHTHPVGLGEAPGGGAPGPGIDPEPRPPAGAVPPTLDPNVVFAGGPATPVFHETIGAGIDFVQSALGLGGGVAANVQVPAPLFRRHASGRVTANRMTRVTNPGTGKDQYFLPAMPDGWKTPVRKVRGPRRHHHHPR